MNTTEGADEVLAKILTSKLIGLIHSRLVGEVIVADARLNEWIFVKGKKRLSADDLIDIVERTQDAEDRYRAAWMQLEQRVSEPSLPDQLRARELALGGRSVAI